jgi:hypothetical protein
MSGGMEAVKRFDKWLAGLPHKHKVVIAGIIVFFIIVLLHIVLLLQSSSFSKINFLCVKTS